METVKTAQAREQAAVKQVDSSETANSQPVPAFMPVPDENKLRRKKVRPVEVNIEEEPSSRSTSVNNSTQTAIEKTTDARTLLSSLKRQVKELATKQTKVIINPKNRYDGL